jgi:nucleotide-binding universal stress UspA family protein
MDTQYHGRPRVVVAVEETLAGYAALRVAVGVARGRRVPLTAISASPIAGCAGRAWIGRAFEEAMGAVPTDVEISGAVRLASPSRALTEAASDPGDLIVVAGEDHGPWRRLWSGSTARNVLVHARCQVLVVPPPEMYRTTRRSLSRLRRTRTDVWDRFETEVPQLRGEPFHGV